MGRQDQSGETPWGGPGLDPVGNMGNPDAEPSRGSNTHATKGKFARVIARRAWQGNFRHAVRP